MLFVPITARNKFLHLIRIFVNTAGATDAGDGVRAVLGDGFLELVGHQVQGLVPGGLPELAVGLDQRHREPFRGVDKVIAEAAFDAETALVGSGALHPGNLDDLAALDVQPQLAAHPAVRAGGADLPGFPGPGLADGFQLQQGPHRAGLDAFAAKDAVRIAIGIIRRG